MRINPHSPAIYPKAQELLHAMESPSYLCLLNAFNKYKTEDNFSLDKYHLYGIVVYSKVWGITIDKTFESYLKTEPLFNKDIYAIPDKDGYDYILNSGIALKVDPCVSKHTFIQIDFLPPVILKD